MARTFPPGGVVIWLWPLPAVAAFAPRPTARSHPDPMRHGPRRARPSLPRPPSSPAPSRVSRPVGARHAGAHALLRLAAEMADTVMVVGSSPISGRWSVVVRLSRGGAVLAGAGQRAAHRAGDGAVLEDGDCRAGSRWADRGGGR